MSTVKLTIDNRQVEVPAGATILEAARSVGIKIPTLCAWTEMKHTPGACRVCMTEVEGQRSLIAACVFPVSEGMVVHTNTEKVRQARKMVVELLLANHPQECNYCVRNGSCELQKVAEFAGLKEVRFDYTQFPKEGMIDRSSPSIVRDSRKCIECHRCVAVCDQIQTVSVLTPAHRGSDVKVVPAFDLPLI
jgi:NADH-quinone oxidoreductase subunit G